jgi:hypothetical protein
MGPRLGRDLIGHPRKVGGLGGGDRLVNGDPQRAGGVEE